MEKLKPQYRRWMFIDQKIRSGSYPNARTLAEGYEVSDKTIKRDLEYLRDSLDAPVEYDTRKRGYYYSDPHYRFSIMHITERDLFALYIAEKVLQQYRGTQVYDRLVPIFDQLESLLEKKISTKMSWLTEQFSFHPEPAPHIDPDNWEAAFRALGETRTLTFRYRVPGYPDSVDRELDPYHVVCYRGEWYVAGWCHYNEEVRLFAVSRMGGAAVSDKTFVVPANFDAQEYFGKTFGIIRSDEEYAVAIMFTSDQAPYIRERIWHEEQSIEDTSDGGLILRFPTSSLFEVKRWVLSWGKAAKVLEPKELVGMVNEELQGALLHY